MISDHKGTFTTLRCSLMLQRNKSHTHHSRLWLHRMYSISCIFITLCLPVASCWSINSKQSISLKKAITCKYINTLKVTCQSSTWHNCCQTGQCNTVLTSHQDFIRYTLLVLGWTSFFLQSCFNLLSHLQQGPGNNFAPYWLVIWWLWRPSEDSELVMLCSRNQLDFLNKNIFNKRSKICKDKYTPLHQHQLNMLVESSLIIYTVCLKLRFTEMLDFLQCSYHSI